MATVRVHCEGGELWRACVRLTLGQYRDKSFRWLLENDVGWTVLLLSEFIVKVVSCGGHVYG